MCQRVLCPTCGKPTWAGCGRHAEQVLAGVPREQRCQCRVAGEAASESNAGKKRKILGLF